MKKGQTSVRNGIEDFLCPFEKMYITQGANGSFSHKGTMANDVTNGDATRAPYYAPCTVKCIKTYPNYGQATWQSIDKVRFANGRIDYATFVTVHDDSFNAKVGMVVKQGQQLGNMGMKGKATGIHCHIQISQSNDTTWKRNKYGILVFNNEYDTDDCYFCDNTKILNMKNANWKYLKDVPVDEKEEWTAGDYKLLYIKALRSAHNLGNNIVKAQNCDPETRKILTKTKGDAYFKAGAEIRISEIYNQNGRIWGRYGNCWVVLCNIDGFSQAIRIS